MGQNNNLVIIPARQLSLLDVAYHGLRLRSYLHLLFGEMWINIEDPKQVVTLTELIVGCTDVLMDNPTATNVKTLLRTMSDRCLRIVRGEEGEEGWNSVLESATFVEQQIANLEYELSGRELAAFKVGRFLQNLDENGTPGKPIRQPHLSNFFGWVKLLLPIDPDIKFIIEKMRIFQENKSLVNFNIPESIFLEIRSLVSSTIILSSVQSSEKARL